MALSKSLRERHRTIGDTRCKARSRKHHNELKVVELAAVVCLAGCAAQIKEKHAEDASKLPALWTQRWRWRL